MGNSLLDICVFGRRAGASAATWAQRARPGEPIEIGREDARITGGTKSVPAMIVGNDEDDVRRPLCSANTGLRGKHRAERTNNCRAFENTQ